MDRTITDEMRDTAPLCYEHEKRCILLSDSKYIIAVCVGCHVERQRAFLRVDLSQVPFSDRIGTKALNKYIQLLRCYEFDDESIHGLPISEV